MRIFIISAFLLTSILLTFSEDFRHSFNTTANSDVISVNNEIPEHIKDSYLKALAFYPALKNQRIRFKESNIKTTLNVRPTLGSILFNKKNNRIYIIRVNNSEKNKEILIGDIPSNARIGLFGHELAHIVDYASLNAFQVIGRGIGYNFAGYRESYEKYIDQITVENGLGWRLYDWATYIQEHPEVPQSYKLFKQKFYMEDEDILEAIEELNVSKMKTGL